MIIVGYRYVSFTSKDSGELVEFAEIYLGNKSDESKHEYGVQIERVTMGKKIYEQYNLNEMMNEKTQLTPIYNRFGKCQGLMKL